jgi:hypothetical protein
MSSSGGLAEAPLATVRLRWRPKDAVREMRAVGRANRHARFAARRVDFDTARRNRAPPIA